MSTTVPGIMQALTGLFKGGDKSNVRDLGKTTRDPFPDYPYHDTIQKRIKWFLDRFYFEAQYEKLQLHRKWFRNHLFFTGYHDSVLSDIGFSFDSIGVNSAEYAFASNYYRSYIRYGAAMYVSTAPEFVSQPTAPDAESQGVAESARSVLEICKENIGYDAIRAIEATNLRIYGNSFRYSYYSLDPRYGFVDQPVYEDVEVQLDAGSWTCPQCGNSGEGHQDVCPVCGPDAPMPPLSTPPIKTMVPRQAGTTRYPQGQEQCEVVWPFEVYARSSAKDLMHAPFLLRVRMADKIGLRATFPKAAEFESGQMPGDTFNASEDIGLIYQQAIPDLPSDPTQYPGWYERAVGASKIPFIQGWIRPNQYFFDKQLARMFPDGMYAAKAEDVLLETRNESMDDHWTHFKHIHVEGRFWGDGDDDLIPIQMQLDEVDRMLMRHVDFNTMPLMLVDSQKLDKSNIINDAGYQVELKNLGQRNIDQAAKWFPGGQISTDVWQWKGTRQQDMEFHSGVFGSAIGQHQPGVNTFGGQESMAARAMQTLGPLQLLYKEANELWAMQMLKICAKNWLDDRVKASMGINGQWEFKVLRGNILKMDKVRIVAQIIPFDPSKQQSLVQAISAGAFNPQLPPQVQRKLLELFQMPTDLNEFSPDAKVQTKEIQSMKGGQAVEPVAFRDNDAAHIYTLQNYMKSDEWDDQQPEVKNIMYQHLLKHFANMSTVAAATGAIQGAGAEAGGQPQQPGQNQENPNNNEQFRHDRGVKGQAAKPNRPQPSGGNQNRTGPRGMSHSAQQRRRNGRNL